MGDSRRNQDGGVGAPLVDAEGMGAILMVKDSVNLGPGKPGPEDEWKIPALPEAGEEIPQEPTPEPALAGPKPGLLQRLTHRG